MPGLVWLAYTLFLEMNAGRCCETIKIDTGGKEPMIYFPLVCRRRLECLTSSTLGVHEPQTKGDVCISFIHFIQSNGQLMLISWHSSWVQRHRVRGRDLRGYINWPVLVPFGPLSFHRLRFTSRYTVQGCLEAPKVISFYCRALGRA